MKENWEIHWKDYFSILQIHPLAAFFGVNRPPFRSKPAGLSE